jgi:hypothetical protein
MKDKGAVEAGVIVLYTWFALATGMSISAIILRPQHIERKAIEKCQQPNDAPDCKVMVAALNKEQRLDYIKDKPTAPTQNFTHR